MSEILQYRLGNLIKSGKGIYRIYAMSVQEILAFQDIKEKIGSECGVYSSLNTIYNHIELTEEWLFKSGFSMKFGTDPQENNPLKVFSIGNFEIMKFEDDKFFFFSTGKGVHIEIFNVHNLQNLFFAMKNSELCFSTEP